MLCARALLLLCAAAAACLARASGPAQPYCTHAKAGLLSGAPFHLAVTYLTPGLPDWKIAVPLPPPECAQGYVTGEEALVCDLDVRPYVRIAENGDILVHRNGYQQGYATVNVTVFCAFSRYGPIPNLQGIWEPPRSLIPVPGLKVPIQKLVPAHEIAIVSKHTSSEAISTSASAISLEPAETSTSKSPRASTSGSASSSTTEAIVKSTSESSIKRILELTTAEKNDRVEELRRSVEVLSSSEETLPSSREEVGPSVNERTLRRPAKFWLLPQEMFDRFMRYMHSDTSVPAPGPRPSLHI